MKKYEQVYISLKHKIDNNGFENGKLPAEKDLEEEFQCSRQTIKTAMSILLEEGLIFRRKGKGTFVRKNLFDYEQKLNNLYIKHDESQKVYSQNKIILFEIIQSNEQVTSLLNLESPENVYHFKRLRYIDGRPETLEDTYIPIRLLPSLQKSDLEGSFFKYVCGKLNLKVESTYKRFVLNRPNEELQSVLEVDNNDYIVHSNDFVVLENGITIAAGNVYYSPRSFEFSSIITTKNRITTI